MSKLLNYSDDFLRMVDNATDVVRPRSTKSLKNVPGQLSMFDDVPKYELAGMSRNKPVYQPSLAQLYDDLAPNSALQSKEYSKYLDGLSDNQIQNLMPQNSLDLINAQTHRATLRRLQEMQRDPNTRSLVELLLSTFK